MQIPTSRHVTGKVLCTRYFNRTEYFNYGLQHSPLQISSLTTERWTRSERRTGRVMRVWVLPSPWDVFSVASRACSAGKRGYKNSVWPWGTVRILHMGVVRICLEQLRFIDIGANRTSHVYGSSYSWHKGRIIERNRKSARVVFHW